jgi:hypothetical protein
MNRLSEEIKSTVPDELVPAVEAVNKILDDAHFRCGKVTEVFCDALLHPGEKLAEAEQYKIALSQLKAIVGGVATETCHQHLKLETAPASFHAMNQLYIAGVTVQAVRVFQDLLEIGSAHADRLGKPYVQWAQDLTLELAKSYENRAKFWIRAVCDPPDFDTDLNWDDPDEIIMGKTWCAPMLLAMYTSRFMPFDATRQRERADRETSKRWLNTFAELFTIHVKLHVDRLAGQRLVELAKQPRAVPEPAAGVAHTGVPTQMIPEHSVPTKVSVTQAYRKRKINARNRKIRSEFKKLEKRRPGMSNTWYSKQLSELEIAGGLDAETIRKSFEAEKSWARVNLPKSYCNNPMSMHTLN